MTLIDIKVPDIGDFKNVPIIEIHVKSGDTVEPEAPLITLESDKATMDVPAPQAGRVGEVLVKIGDKVSEGTPILKLDGANGAAAAAPAVEAPPAADSVVAPAVEGQVKVPEAAPPSEARAVPPPFDFGNVHASPSVRMLARELDIDLTKLTGTGEKGRITKEDVKRAVARTAAPSAPSTGAGIPEIPAQDFSKFGPIEEKPLSRLKKLSGPHLHRAWLNIPHVTQSDEADITE
ncbi:MAG TPA: biotin/lipoyl-containing protein, partial [Rhodomicrobium sp.]|nr:biotin/lipoyl-containing protein [Rhodomicrobium sp.]